MAKKKLLRFEQIRSFPNVLEYPPLMKGKWHSFIGNNNPIVLELACGRGEYTTGLANIHPDKNFIGIDIKGNRMFIGARYAIDNNLRNAFFLRTQIEQIENYFAENEVSEIWITFPDPQLRISKAKKRLTHPRFLRLYKQFLKSGGSIHLKTDSPQLYYFTLTVCELYGLPVVENSDDVYANNPGPDLSIKTHYEKLDIAGVRKVHYIRFQLNDMLPDKDEELKEILNNAHID